MAQYIRSIFGIDDIVRTRSGAVLAQGGKPQIVTPRTLYALPFDVLVLCAMEIQPELRYADLEVVHAPMDDDYEIIPEGDIERAIDAAQIVRARLLERKRVLVTCHHGRNRSGIVSAMAICLTYGKRPSEAIAMVRDARRDSLTNPQFVRVLMAAEDV